MAITALWRLINNFSSPITITLTDLENSSLPPVQASQGQMVDCNNIWIPWCTSQKDFNNHHYITITSSNVQYYIWQAAHNDGDFVRFSTNGYQEPGTLILNDASVSGDRCIIVDENGLALWRFGGSVEIPWFPENLRSEHENWHMQHMPSTFSPAEAVEFLQFHCQFLDQVHAWYDSQSFANQSLVASWGPLPSFFGLVNASGQTPGATYISDEQKFRSNPSLWGATDGDIGFRIQSDIHGWGHTYAMPTLFNDPFMSDFAQAPRSIYFYKWHGLINGWWHIWQRAMAPSGWIERHCQPLLALDARFISQSVPSSVTVNSTFNASVTMQNIGESTWTPGGSHPFRLGSQNLQDNTTWGISRVDVPSAVAPGAQVTFNLALKAPGAAGTYNFQWQMVEELIAWFGDSTPDVSIGVSYRKSPKAEKDVKDHKERDIATFGPAGQFPEVEAGDAETVQGQSFITSDERPAVSGQAEMRADEA